MKFMSERKKGLPMKIFSFMRQPFFIPASFFDFGCPPPLPLADVVPCVIDSGKLFHVFLAERCSFCFRRARQICRFVFFGFFACFSELFSEICTRGVLATFRELKFSCG